MLGGIEDDPGAGVVGVVGVVALGGDDELVPLEAVWLDAPDGTSEGELGDEHAAANTIKSMKTRTKPFLIRKPP
jgi:hypothetical protein